MRLTDAFLTAISDLYPKQLSNVFFLKNFRMLSPETPLKTQYNLRVMF